MGIESSTQNLNTLENEGQQIQASFFESVLDGFFSLLIFSLGLTISMMNSDDGSDQGDG